MVKKQNAETIAPPRPLGLASATTVPRPLPNRIGVPRPGDSKPAPVRAAPSTTPATLVPATTPAPRVPVQTGLRPIALGGTSSIVPAPISTRPRGVTSLATSPTTPAAAPVAPISIRPSGTPLSPVEKARVETLVTQVDVADSTPAFDLSPATIPETPAYPPAPESSISVKTKTGPSTTIPDTEPSSQSPVAISAEATMRIPPVATPVSRTAPIPPAPISSFAAPRSAPAPTAMKPPVASPWRVVTPIQSHAGNHVPWAPATPIPSPVITPVPQMAHGFVATPSSVSSLDVKLDTPSGRSHSLVSFSDLAGLARAPMRSDHSSASIVLGDPVIRQKMMSIVAARRRRFTAFVLSAVAVCAAVCAAAVIGTLSGEDSAAEGTEQTLRTLKTSKEELLVPGHKLTSARARRWNL